MKYLYILSVILFVQSAFAAKAIRCGPYTFFPEIKVISDREIPFRITEWPTDDRVTGVIVEQIPDCADCYTLASAGSGVVETPIMLRTFRTNGQLVAVDQTMDSLGMPGSHNYTCSERQEPSPF